MNVTLWFGCRFSGLLHAFYFASFAVQLCVSAYKTSSSSLTSFHSNGKWPFLNREEEDASSTSATTESAAAGWYLRSIVKKKRKKTKKKKPNQNFLSGCSWLPCCWALLQSAWEEHFFDWKRIVDKTKRRYCTPPSTRRLCVCIFFFFFLSAGNSIPKQFF